MQQLYVCVLYLSHLGMKGITGVSVRGQVGCFVLMEAVYVLVAGMQPFPQRLPGSMCIISTLLLQRCAAGLLHLMTWL